MSSSKQYLPRSDGWADWDFATPKFFFFLSVRTTFHVYSDDNIFFLSILVTTTYIHKETTDKHWFTNDHQNSSLTINEKFQRTQTRSCENYETREIHLPPLLTAADRAPDWRSHGTPLPSNRRCRDGRKKFLPEGWQHKISSSSSQCVSDSA